jgi:3-deoxy-D-manno-octulosonate 8-phosphate phosphatase (KDO 8-P phosphatase)
VITGRESASVALRAAELELDECVQDRHARKASALRAMLARRGIGAHQVAFVGDDLPDLGALRMVGLPVAVGNAVPEVRAASRVRLTREGGRGAVREFAERLLSARGEWDARVEAYVRGRDAAPSGAQEAVA